MSGTGGSRDDLAGWQSLEAALADLERTDPAVAAAADNYDRTVGRLVADFRDRRKETSAVLDRLAASASLSEVEEALAGLDLPTLRLVVLAAVGKLRTIADTQEG